MPAALDLTGQRYGRLFVRGPASGYNGRIMWDCVCDCGEQVDVSTVLLRAGKKKSCGCLRRETTAALKFKDLTGQRFGRATVKRYVGSQDNRALWECACDCGEIFCVKSSRLLNGDVTDCGCSSGWPGRNYDLTGEQFGRLTVTSFGSTDGKHNYWMCSCSCGKTTVVSQDCLRSGITKSCGCLRVDMLRERSITHGMSTTRVYHIWQHMKQRCNNPEDDPEERYYFAGITYCEEWERFEPFMEWAEAHGYTEFLTLDRINPYGNYEPSNCRWISQEQQMRNTTVQYNALFKEALEYAFADVGALIPTIVSLFVQEHYNDKYWATQLKTMSFDLLDPDSEETLIQFLRETYMAVLRIYTVKYVDLVSRSSSHIDNELISFGDLCYSELVKQ